MEKFYWQRRLHAAFGAGFNALAGALMLGLRRLEREIDPAVLEEMLGLVVAFDEPLNLCQTLVKCDCPLCVEGTIKTYSDDYGGECLTMLGRQTFAGASSITFMVVISFRELLQDDPSSRFPEPSWQVSLGLCTENLCDDEMWIAPPELFDHSRGPYRLVFDFVPVTGRLSIFRVDEHDGVRSCVALASDDYGTRHDWTNSHPCIEMYYASSVQIIRSQDYI